MRRLALKICTIFLLASLSSFAMAHEFLAGDLRIIHPWAALVAPDSRTCSVYVVVMTQGGADRLLGASTPAAKNITMHAMASENGVAVMQPIKAIGVEPGSPVLFTPTGSHFMLNDMFGPLLVDTYFPLTLHFERTGDVKIDVFVQKDGSMPAEHQHQEHVH